VRKDWTKLPEAYARLLWAFLRVWWTLARRTTPWTYLRRTFVYRAYLRTGRSTAHGTRVIGPDEAAELPDNSARYETFTYSYEGLDDVKALIADGKPLAFVTWHHGACWHLPYAIARVLPRTAIFTRLTFQFGKVFSYSMLGAGVLGLLKMARFLEEGRPIIYHLDGVPLGHTVRLRVLGSSSRLSTGPIQVMRSIPGMRLVPVTAYYAGGTRVETIFHRPRPASDHLPLMSDREVLVSLLTLLERDQRERAPEQVMWRFALHRERVAQRTEAERALRRREMLRVPYRWRPVRASPGSPPGPGPYRTRAVRGRP
jgi:hypothetical protein